MHLCSISPHLFGLCGNLSHVSRIFECHNVVSIEAYCSTVFGFEKQILSSEEHRVVPMVRVLGKYFANGCTTLIHEFVNYQERSLLTIEITAFRKSFTKFNLRIFCEYGQVFSVAVLSASRAGSTSSHTYKTLSRRTESCTMSCRTESLTPTCNTESEDSQDYMPSMSQD